MKLKRRKPGKGKVKLKRREKKVLTKSEVLEKFFKIIENNTTAWYGIFENAECLKCGAVAKGMIRVGSMKFCFNCFQEEFGLNLVERDKVVYDKWLEYQHKRWEEELL
jgi:hypothetical protein